MNGEGVLEHYGPAFLANLPVAPRFPGIQVWDVHVIITLHGALFYSRILRFAIRRPQVPVGHLLWIVRRCVVELSQLRAPATINRHTWLTGADYHGFVGTLEESDFTRGTSVYTPPDF
jgi:hypothetical protein